MSKTLEKLANNFGRDTIPQSSRETYPHSVVGHRPKLRWYMVFWYIVNGSDSWYTVDRIKGIGYLVVHFAPTRSTPGGSADYGYVVESTST